MRKLRKHVWTNQFMLFALNNNPRTLQVWLARIKFGSELITSLVGVALQHPATTIHTTGSGAIVQFGFTASYCISLRSSAFSALHTSTSVRGSACRTIVPNYKPGCGAGAFKCRWHCSSSPPPGRSRNVHSSSGSDVGCDCAFDMGSADKREMQVACATGTGCSRRGTQY